MRQKAKNQSVRITITTHPKVQECLERLLDTGLYGGSVSEAAEILLCEQLRNDLKRKRITALEGAK